MDFSGLDFAAGRFTQTSTYLVTVNVLPKASLQLAMARLIEAWPAVTLRVNMLRYRAYKSETPSMLDEMLKVRTLDSSVAPYLKQEESNHGVAFRDCQTLAKLFEGNRVSWTDYLCPRVALVEAALFQDASVVKFTTQHVACDVVGLYNVAAAFCEGLFGDVDTRGTCEGGRYKLKEIEEPRRDCKEQKPIAGNKPSRAGTPGVGYLAWIRVLLRSWAASWQNPSRWRAMYIPGSIIDDWREAARSAGVSVSPFNLVAAWVHMGLADEAAANCLGGRERMIISVSLRKYFECPPEKSDLWNPTAGIAMSPFAQTPESLQHQRIVRQALSIRG